MLTFAAGETTKTVAAQTTADADGDDESFTLTLSNPANATFAGGATTLTATGTITDDDDLPELRVADASADEGTAVSFEVTLSPAASSTVTVNWAASPESGDTAAAGADFTAASGTLTFAANDATETVTVATVGDALDEADETFTLTLSNASSNALLAGGGTTLTATGTITDDDDLPELRVADASATEGGVVSFEVTLSAASGRTATVEWATSVESGDTAEADDLTTGLGTLTFAAGETRKTVAATTTADADGDDESFTLTLSNPANATFAGSATTLTATGTIAEDEGPVPTVTLVDVQPRESTAGGLVERLELHLSCPDCPPATEPGSVWFDVVAIPTHHVRVWQDPNDEAAGCAPIVEANAGDILVKSTFRADFYDPEDARIENLYLTVETAVPCHGRPVSSAIAAAEFTLELQPRNGGLQAGPAWVVDTRGGFDEFKIVCRGADCPTDDLIDDNPIADPPTLDVAIVDGNALELRFDRLLDEESVPAPKDFTVVIDDSASSPLAGSGARGRSRAASAVEVRGEETLAVTLAVTAVEVRGDTVVLTLVQAVPHRTHVTVSYTPGAAPLRDRQGVEVRPIGDKAAVETAVSVVAARAVEGEAVRFPVRLSRAVASAVTVDWALAPGSATPDTDYAGPFAGSLTIEAATTTGTIVVPTARDAEVEDAETFTLTLTEPEDFPRWALLKVETATATGTITDEDPGDDDSGDDDPGDDDSGDDDPGDDDSGDDDSGDDPSTGGGGGAAPAVGPQAPVDLSALARPGRLLLAWTAAAQGEPALEFEYRASANDGASWSEWTPIPDSGPAEANAGGVELAGLASGSSYLVEVRGLGDPRLGDARFGAAARVEAVSGTWPVWLFPAAADAAGRQGFARVVNRSAAAGTVRVVAHDDWGTRRGPAVLSIGAGETKHFNSADLETGNAAKGLAPGIGSGQGDWRLALSSALDIEVFAYQRTADGFLTSMHDVAPPAASGARRVVVFNPGGNPNQVSWLRLVNTTPAPAPVRIRGVDDAGDSPGGEVRLTLARGSSRTLSALQLERGAAPDLEGALGDGAGKWRLLIEAPAGVAALSLLSSPTGHLTNLSTMPPPRADGAHAVHLFPSAADASGRQGFVRVANRSADSGEVRIEAFDDSTWVYDPATLAIGAGETRHFNSDDLESGNAAKGLADGVGAGSGDWRLTLTSDLPIDVLSYIRTADGFLTSMHDTAPGTASGAGTVRRVAVFNPASNRNQASLLRLVNPGSAPALVRIGGVDDEGAQPGGVVRVTVPAGGSRTLSAPELETGEAEGLAGRLGDGSGKWTLTVESDAPIAVLSLLESVGGRLTNLSAAPYARPLPNR